MRTWALFFCLIATHGFAAQPAPEAEPAYWTFAHPNARLLIGLKLSGSPIAKMMTEFRHQAKDLPPQADSLFQMFDQIDTVLISAAGPRAGSTDSPSLITLRGRFDLDQVRSMLTSANKESKFTTYGGVPLLQMTSGQVSQMAPEEIGGIKLGKQLSKKDSAIALVDASTLVMGDPLSVRQAIDHAKDNQRIKVRYPMFVKARSLSSTYDFWAVLDVPAPKADDPANPAPPNPMMAIGRTVRGVDVGLNLRQGMDFQANLHMATAKDAQSFGGMISAVLPMMARQRISPPAANTQLTPQQSADLVRRSELMSGILEKLKVMQEDSAVIVRLTLNQAELDGLKREIKFDKIIKSIPSGGIMGDSDPAVSGTSPAPDLPKEKQVIRIYGLDDGVKEIPVEPKKP